jgi:hypothetical protein
MFVKLALDEETGNVKVTDDGKPIYLDKDDKEVPVDAPQMYQKIIDLGKENKTFREAGKELKKKFAMFDEIEDVPAWHAEAVKALETVANFNEKDWLKAEKVESMKRQMNDAHEADVVAVKESFEGKLTEKDNALTRKDNQIRKLTVSANFGQCPMFIGEKRPTSMTPDAAEAIFGPNIKVEEDPKDPETLLTRIYYDKAGSDLIYSVANPGEPAEFNEGMQILWETYPQKNNYKRGDGGGSGAQGGGDGGDETVETSDIATLQKQYDEAIAAKQTTKAISIKNRLFALKQKQRAA